MSLSARELAALFPPGVIVSVAGPADADPGALLDGEREHAAPMAPRRRAEFAAGRAAARQALGALGVAPVPLTRVTGERHVAWPAGIAGSISHAEGLIAAAVARLGLPTAHGALAGIGLDVEVAAPLAAEIVPRICLPEELAALEPHAAPAPGWPTLLFAMKEAAYKAWYPVTLVPLDFHDMQVAVDPAGRFYAAVRPDGELEAALRAHALDASSYRVHGQWTAGANHVAASAILISSP